MNRKAIKLTALCQYDESDKTFTVSSPIFERVLGCARTEEEAWRLFNEILDETYVAYLEGNLAGYEKRGRPSKGNVDLHAQLKPEVKQIIDAKAKEFGISQGEVIAYLTAVEVVKQNLEQRFKKLQIKVNRLQPKRT